MTEEFNLSDKRIIHPAFRGDTEAKARYSEEDVKEYIKVLKQYFKDITKDLGYTEKDYCLSLKDIEAGIEEYAGKKLI